MIILGRSWDAPAMSPDGFVAIRPPLDHFALGRHSHYGHEGDQTQDEGHVWHPVGTTADQGDDGPNDCRNPEND
jgi:hypothetical protein